VAFSVETVHKQVPDTVLGLYSLVKL